MTHELGTRFRPRRGGFQTRPYTAIPDRYLLDLYDNFMIHYK